MSEHEDRARRSQKRTRLFGTDGVRGRAGDVLTPELALKLARAAVSLAPTEHPRVLIVTDTRESRWMLASAVAAGVTAAGGDAFVAGVLPTPAAPILVRRLDFDLAVVITASHNPYQDNGIKFFGADGFKLDDETEDEIEARLDADLALPTRFGTVHRLEDALEHYLIALQTRFAQLELRDFRVLLDCANGATFRAAPEIFRWLGADVHVLADEPNGRNINERCGATHLDLIREEMLHGSYDIGLAFDGDGDRVIAIDQTGAVVDGDELVALAALHLRGLDQLPGNGVAVTVMANYGFHIMMREAGIQVATTAVGDRYVLEELRRRGWALGGEQSGHVIQLGFGPSGDGIATALLLLEALGARDLSERAPMTRLPQELVNVPAGSIASLSAAMDDAAVNEAIERERAALEGRGQILVRASGTEPVIRVMVQAPTEEETADVCARLVAAVERALAGLA